MRMKLKQHLIQAEPKQFQFKQLKTSLNFKKVYQILEYQNNQFLHEAQLSLFKHHKK